MKLKQILIVVAMLMGALPLSAGTGHRPFPFTIQNPLYVLNLAMPPTTSAIPDAGEWSVEQRSSYTNLYEVGNGATLTHLLDMEMLRQSLVAEYGVSDDFSLYLELPFLHFEGGMFDAWIQDFHNAFGFPNGGRERRPNGAFDYRVDDTSGTLFQVSQQAYGLGDMVTGFGHQLLSIEGNPIGLAYRFYFKWPTGAGQKGLGNGGVDYGFQLAADRMIGPVRTFVNLGYTVVWGTEALQPYMNDHMISGAAGAIWPVSRVVAIQGELVGSSPLYKGMGKSSWDSFPLDLVLGVSGLHPDVVGNADLTWQAGFSEDLNANGPSTDLSIVVTTGLRWR